MTQIKSSFEKREQSIHVNVHRSSASTALPGSSPRRETHACNRWGGDPPGNNTRVAALLDQAADLIETQGETRFRAEALRRAARAFEALPEDLGQIVASGGRGALMRLPNIGPGIASAIVEILLSGRWSRLDRLRGTVRPEALSASLPGIGPALARRIHDTLGVDSLEGLECAVHDGRIRSVRGVDARRDRAIRAGLAEVLGARQRPIPAERPPVSVLLDVDAEYRTRAKNGSLPRITPRRFNPEGAARLPVHTTRGEWHFTALFSNTARAHELGRTEDWVVRYASDGSHHEQQSTVVTETRGPLRARRVVRGREAECARHYGLGAAPGRPTSAA